MKKRLSDIDYQFIRDVVRAFVEENNIRYHTELGRVLAPKLKSPSEQSTRGKEFWGKDYEEKLTVAELDRLAQWIGLPARDLVQPTYTKIIQGDHGQQITQNGKNSVVNVGSVSEPSASDEEKREFKEFQKWREEQKKETKMKNRACRFHGTG